VCRAVLPGALAECLDGQAPIAVRLVDVENRVDVLRLPLSRSGVAYRRVLVFLRRGGYPLGWIALPVSEDGEVSLETLDEAFDQPGEAPLATTDSPVDNSAATFAMESLLSVVVATCANVDSVVRCVEGIQASVT